MKKLLIFLVAAGCAIVGPYWEVQREILDDGDAGICVRPQADDVRRALEILLVDNERRLQLACAARLRYEQMFAPNVVAQKYLEMCRAAIFKSASPRGTQ